MEFCDSLKNEFTDCYKSAKLNPMAEEEKTHFIKLTDMLSRL
jgi:hypothetical protein